MGFGSRKKGRELHNFLDIYDAIINIALAIWKLKIVYFMLWLQISHPKQIHVEKNNVKHNSHGRIWYTRCKSIRICSFFFLQKNISKNNSSTISKCTNTTHLVTEGVILVFSTISRFFRNVCLLTTQYRLWRYFMTLSVYLKTKCNAVSFYGKQLQVWRKESD